MKKIGLMIVTIVAVAMLSGCGNVNVRDKGMYDQLVSDNSNTQTSKYSFYIPYTEIKLGQLLCDSTFTVKAMKEVFGNKVTFTQDQTSNYIINVKDLTQGVFPAFWNSNHARYDTIADFTMDGKTKKLTGIGIDLTLPGTFKPEQVKEICSSGALDLAKQIKALTDAQSK